MKKERRIKTITKEEAYNVYISEDGKEFNTEEECYNDELELKEEKLRKINEIPQFSYEYGDYCTWFYIRDKIDWISLKEHIKKHYYKPYFNIDLDENDYIDNWVSYNVKSGGDYNDECYFVTYEYIKMAYLNIKSKIEDFKFKDLK